MNNNASKFLRQKGLKNFLIVSIIMIIIGVILLIIGIRVVDDNKNIVAKDYRTLINSKNDNSGEFVKINISFLPYLFAEETNNYGNIKYYIVVDDNFNYYIVRLHDKTFEKLEKIYNNNEKISYELKGYLYSQNKEVKSLAIKTFKEIFLNDKINENNANEYIGKTYLDEVDRPGLTKKDLLIMLGSGSAIIGVMFVVISIIYIKKTNKTLKKFGKEKLYFELSKPSTIYYTKEEVCLTDNYIISKLSGLNVIKYEDILWIYNENRMLNGVSIGFYLIARTKDNKIHQIAWSHFDEQIINEIADKIYDKNNNILIGFTNENENKYKKLIEKYKM